MNQIGNAENTVSAKYPKADFGEHGNPWAGPYKISAGLAPVPSPDTADWLRQHPKIGQKYYQGVDRGDVAIFSSTIPGYDLMPDLNRRNIGYVPSDILADALSQPAGTALTIAGLAKGGRGRRTDARLESLPPAERPKRSGRRPSYYTTYWEQAFRWRAIRLLRRVVHRAKRGAPPAEKEARFQVHFR